MGRENGKSGKGRRGKNGAVSIFRRPQLLLMLLPGMSLLLLFRYIPMFHIVTAFQDYNVFQGVWGSEWVGFANFERLFASPDFYKVLRNTIIISGYKLIFGFPVPIILAFMMNEVRKGKFIRILQNISYLPHFLAWTIIGGLCLEVFSRTGILNQVIVALGGEPIPFLMSPKWFRLVLVLSDIWKEAG